MKQNKLLAAVLGALLSGIAGAAPAAKSPPAKPASGYDTAARRYDKIDGAAVANPAAENARPTVPWIDRGVIYQISPRNFTPEGTLAAAAKKLPHLAKLGVTVAYLLPVFVADDDMDQKYWSKRQIKSGLDNPRNPYRMKDYFHVDKEYGADADLHDFIKTAHSLGLKVFLDLVYIHCGPAAVLLKDNPGFINRDENGGIALVGTWPFPRFNFKNQKVREYLWSNMEYYVRDFDVDGFRCDVGGGIPLDFWEEGRRRCEKIKPDFAMVDEAQRARDQLFAFDADYDTPFAKGLPKTMRGEATASDLWDIIAKGAHNRPRGYRWLRYVTNHDIATDDCAEHGERREKTWGEDGAEAALVAVFGLRGVPMLYNGTEFNDTSTQSFFGKGFPIDWAKLDTPAGREYFALTQKLIALRKSNPALSATAGMGRRGNDREDAVLSVVRSHEGKKLTVVINFSNEPVTVKIKTGSVKKIILAKTGVKQTAGATFTLPARGWLIGEPE
jgi:glycosidase